MGLNTMNHDNSIVRHAAWKRLGVALLLVLAVSAARAADTRSFTEGRSGSGELKYVNDLPVLIVAGTPEEMGRQAAVLTGDVVKKLIDYPRKLVQQRLKGTGGQERLAKCLEMSKSLVPQLSADHRAELRAAFKQLGVDRDLGILGNVLPDVYRGGFSCSSIVVEADHSATKGPLFGRNLDFYTLNMLGKYSLVTVRRPNGKHAFVSIGFPGMFGCLSGMNDAVFEITPKNVAVRHSNDGILACTNHFRTSDLAVPLLKWCPRYQKLIQARKPDQLDMSDVAKKLDDVHMAGLTVQTMIFEPATLKLHLAIGSIPSSALPMKELDLKPLFKP